MTTTLSPALPAPAAAAAARPLYRFEALLDPHPIGLIAEGLRMTVPFEGRITGGELAEAGFAGARVWGIDHFLLRPDGVGVLDAQKTLSAGDRHLYEHVRGYCLPPAGFEPPPLAALLEPGFAWPDLPFPLIGSCHWRVAVPELARLNREIGIIEGSANYATGALEVETRLVRPARA